MPASLSLTPAQQQAVAASSPNVLVTGSFGTGTTAVLAHVAGTSAGDGASLLLAGTESAARTLRHRIGDEAPAVRVSTPPSLAASLLRRHGEAIGLRRFSVVDDAAARQVVERALEATGTTSPEVSARSVYREICRVRHLGASPRDLDDPLSCDADVLREVFPVYVAMLNRTRTLDRTALVARAADLLDASAPARDGLHGRFTQVVVDDAQNLTPAEVRLVQLATADDARLVAAAHPSACTRRGLGAGPAAARDLFAVRDEPETVRLNEPFRPPPSPRRLDAALSGTSTGASDASNGDSTGDSTGDPTGSSTEAPGNTTESSSKRENSRRAPSDDLPAVLLEASSQDREVDAVARRVRHFIEEEDVVPSSVAIIGRTRPVLSPIADALRDAGVSVALPRPLDGRDAVRDVCAYLHVAANPHDDARLLRILNRPSRGIGRTTQARLRADARQHDRSIWASIQAADDVEALSARTRRAVGRFRELMQPFVERARKEAPEAWARELVDAAGYLTPVTRSHTTESLDRRAQVETVLDALPGASPTSDAPMPVCSFLHRITLRGRLSEPEPGVILGTPCDVEGREAEVVFVIGLEEERFPLEGAMRRQPLLADECDRLRLALTRTRRRLFLSWARSRPERGKDVPTTRSRFLDALPADALHEAPARPPSAAPDDAPDAYRSVDPYYYRDTLRAAQASARPRPQPTAEEVDRIRSGQRIEHPKMGRGTVVRTDGEGDERVAVIDFDDRGRKNIRLQYVHLDVLEG